MSFTPFLNGTSSLSSSLRTREQCDWKRGGDDRGKEPVMSGPQTEYESGGDDGAPMVRAQEQSEEGGGAGLSLRVGGTTSFASGFNRWLSGVAPAMLTL